MRGCAWYHKSGRPTAASAVSYGAVCIFCFCHAFFPEVALKDRCYVDANINCDEWIATPVFVDVIQANSVVVIEPYPILREPAPRQPGFFKRLLSWFPPAYLRRQSFHPNARPFRFDL